MSVKWVLSMAAVLTVFMILRAGAQVADAEIDVEKLIREIDTLYRSESSYAELEMEIVTPDWQRTLVMKSWTRGMDKTFIRITSPLKERGVATLRIENEMWNFLPKTNKVVKVPPSMMMSSWMGSDFTNDDLVKEFSLFKDYTYELLEPPDGAADLYYINCIPHEGLPIVWGNIVIAVRRDGRLPVWQKYYDEKGNLMREMTYAEVKKFGDRLVPSVMEMAPATREGHKTIFRYRDVRFNVAVDDAVFSLRNLQSRE
ncbi:MAG: outer membrane lipoprotein-sorting protein [candidate division Zixibacteria bacterium]|nr:outer membrane lipoprotein-sorting protein [candidate division Zixibacteria bacterium]MDD5427227.1 outer membrane lipoprotein-sorting protein [candidate division Zixibacteria bacterium]